MDMRAHMHSSTSRFGGKEGGLVLLVSLLVILFSDYFLARLLEYLQESVLRGKSENEIAALRSIALGFINPALIIGVSAALLKSYFPKHSIISICQMIGLTGEPSVRVVGWSFGVGMIYVFLFMALAHFFPPSEFAAPHPENVINYASTGGKILFALAACTIVPMAEEILFRGVLYQGIANSWGKLVSTICVSIAFIAVHPGTLGSGYWVTHTALFISPILMILLREFAGSLYAPIGAHAGFNFAEIFF